MTEVSNNPSQTTSRSPQQVAEILKKHPGVIEALVYPVAVPGQDDVLMAAVALDEKYKWTTQSSWDRIYGYEPRDRDDDYAYRICKGEDTVNGLFADIVKELPEDEVPIFFRFVSEYKLADVSVQETIKKEGWDHDYVGIWPDRMHLWNPVALGLQLPGEGYKSFGYWEHYKLKGVIQARAATGDSQSA